LSLNISKKRHLSDVLSVYEFSANNSLWANRHSIALLDELSVSLLTEFVKRFFFLSSNRIDIKKTYELVGGTNTHKKLLTFILSVLEKQGIIKIASDNFVYLTGKELVSSDVLYQKSLLLLDEYSGIVKLIKLVIDAYFSFFTQKKNGLQVLFPDGTGQLIKRLLSMETRPYSNAVDFCPIIAKTLDSIDDSRVIEVGGGAGLLTWKCLSLLKRLPKQYLFTDISRRFVLTAQQTSEQESYSFLDFSTLDISIAPDENLQERFDIVLAYNVVHATQNVFQSLQNVSALLKSGGLLVLVELCAPFLWEHLTWGLTDGWWLFDDRYRKGGPTLDFDIWETVLIEAGFHAIYTFPKTRKERYDSGLFIYKKAGLD